ncbi:MAG: DoxX family membrane protein [Gemmataceae bacterium]
MKWLALALRIIVGGGFIAFGSMYFLNLMPKEQPPGIPEMALRLGEGFGSTGWMTVVKVCELVGGLLVLSGRLTPLGLVILVPVTVNIAIWDALVMKYSMPPIGTVLLALEIVLMVLYRSHFRPLLDTKSQIG